MPGLLLSSFLAAQVPIYLPFGDACAGSASGSNLLLVDPPVLGGTLRVDIDNLPDNCMFMLTGFSQASSQWGTLPLRLDSFGVIGPYSLCYLYVSPDSIRFLAGMGNRATYTLPIPNFVGLVGLTFYQQAIVQDQNAGNPAQAVMSRAAQAVVGYDIGSPNLVPIAAGTFQMGSLAVGGTAIPVHTVTISHPFWIGRCEVTQAEYQAVMNSNPSYFQGASYPGAPNRPVERVTWNEAIAYCQTLTSLEIAAGRIPPGYKYRLPTEAEWEYCCRAGRSTEWGIGGGTSLTCTQANINHCVDETALVGSYAANAWGLRDMHGNVWEWCFDSWDYSANYAAGATSDPYVYMGPNRTARGGAWTELAAACRSGYRNGASPTTRANNVGFRVVLGPNVPGPLTRMVPIAAGSFPMGSPVTPLNVAPYYNGSSSQPVHTVTISQPFWMGRYEVTQEEYLALVGVNPSYYQPPHILTYQPNRPVEMVSWNDAAAYCMLLTAQEAAAGRLPAGYQYRLPTEAEWEYCCRAGTTTEFHCGPTLDCSQANFGYSYHTSSSCDGLGTRDVGGYSPNAWGLYDMHGNVVEWCLDAWNTNAGYTAGSVTDPFVSGALGGSVRIQRGGSMALNSNHCRSASRGGFIPGYSYINLGFRVVLAPILVP